MFRKFIAILVCIAFFLSNFQYAFAQDFSIDQLPVPGKLLGVSEAFTPLLIKGLVAHPDKPFNFDFIVDSGNDLSTQAAVKEQGKRIVKYFLTALTVPEDSLWVNLSPFEKDRIIDQSLGQTLLGRDMLAQDYVLKQFTASMLYPDNKLGKDFWTRIYKEAKEKFGTTDIPVNTFNKVWIVPQKAEVFEKDNAVYVTQAELKVMLDSDYRALSKNNAASRGPNALKDDIKASLTKDIIRQIVLPAIKQEVNHGRNFALLRQIYYAAILAKWYRQLVMNTLISDTYIGKSKISGVENSDKMLKERLYQRYILAYKKGVFNYIKEDKDGLSGNSVARKYFSGGLSDFAMKSIPLSRTEDVTAIKIQGKIFVLGIQLKAEDQAVMSGQDGRLGDLKESFRDQLVNTAMKAITEHVKSVKVDGEIAQIDEFGVRFNRKAQNEEIARASAAVFKLIDDNGRVKVPIDSVQVDVSRLEPTGKDGFLEGAVDLYFRSKPAKDEGSHPKDWPGYLVGMVQLSFIGGKIEDKLKVESMIVHQGPLGSAHYYKGGFKLKDQKTSSNLVLTKHQEIHQMPDEVTMKQVDAGAFFDQHGKLSYLGKEVKSHLDGQEDHFVVQMKRGRENPIQDSTKLKLTSLKLQRKLPDNSKLPALNATLQRKVGVIYIGPGQYALDDSHLEAMGLLNGTISEKILEKASSSLGKDVFSWLSDNKYLVKSSDTEGRLIGNVEVIEQELMVLYPSKKQQEEIKKVLSILQEALKGNMGNVKLVAVVNRMIDKKRDSQMVQANDTPIKVRSNVEHFIEARLGEKKEDVEINVGAFQKDDFLKSRLNGPIEISMLEAVSSKGRAIFYWLMKEGYVVQLPNNPGHYIFNGDIELIKQYLKEENYPENDVERIGDVLQTSINHGSMLKDEIKKKVNAFKKRNPGAAVAVIVGTQSRYHKQYIKWAIKNGYHVLADKPLTTPEWDRDDSGKMTKSDSVKASKSDSLVTDADEIIKLSQEKDRNKQLIMVATQKRYSESLRRIRKALADFSSPIQYLQLTTNDGWWVDPDALDQSPARGESYSLSGDGGKLSHTGYHIFDLVPLILDDENIRKAEVRATFQRPEDIRAYENLIERGKNADNWNKNKVQYNKEGILKDLQGLMEVNANIEIIFTRKRVAGKEGSKIIVNLGMFHGGPSSKSEVGRTKTETIALVSKTDSLGAVRIDKFLKDGKRPEITASSPEGISANLCDGDSKDVLENARPGLDFFNTLLYAKDLNNINARVKSPLVSHTIGIKLMAASLMAGYSGHPVTFYISKNEWHNVDHILNVNKAQTQGHDVGGIDIQNIDVTNMNGRAKIQFNDNAMRAVIHNGFNGFTPVIISITPIQSLFSLKQLRKEG